jgi:hypothetical protein
MKRLAMMANPKIRPKYGLFINRKETAAKIIPMIMPFPMPTSTKLSR